MAGWTYRGHVAPAHGRVVGSDKVLSRPIHLSLIAEVKG